jgi:hypothetical protein
MRFLLVAGAALAVSFTAFAQTDRGTSTVTDPAGAVIAGATVQAKNEATGAVYEPTSSATGNYTVAQLPAGTYDLTVSSPGFKRLVRAGLLAEGGAGERAFLMAEQEVAAILRVDAAMQVGAAAETIEVTGAAPLLQTESTEVSHNVGTAKLDEIPILTLADAGNNASSNYFNPNSGGLGNIRNPLSSVNLLPGTNFTTDNMLQVNGMPSSSMSINVEGQDASNGLARQLTQITQPSTDAIQEMASIARGSIQLHEYAGIRKSGHQFHKQQLREGYRLLRGQLRAARPSARSKLLF